MSGCQGDCIITAKSGQYAAHFTVNVETTARVLLVFHTKLPTFYKYF